MSEWKPMSEWNQRSRGNYGNQKGEGQPRQSFPNSGALFSNRNKRSEQSPDLTGNIEISEDVLDYIVREATLGNTVRVELSGWMRTGRNNNTFTSVKINIPYNVRMEETSNPVYRKPSYQPRQAPQREAPIGRSGYAEQSRGEPTPGGRFRTDPPRPAPQRQTQEEFAKGDQMPDFLRDDDYDPHKPPF